VRRKTFLRLEGLSFRGREDLSIDQLFNGKNLLFSIGLLRFEKTIQALFRGLRPVGTTYIVAPDRERSACSLAVTLRRPLRAQRVKPRIWAVEGTPVDCIYFALQKFLPRRPDLIISGMNSCPPKPGSTVMTRMRSTSSSGVLLPNCLPETYRCNRKLIIFFKAELMLKRASRLAPAMRKPKQAIDPS
jgi:hypothetical protein